MQIWRAQARGRKPVMLHEENGIAGMCGRRWEEKEEREEGSRRREGKGGEEEDW